MRGGSCDSVSVLHALRDSLLLLARCNASVIVRSKNRGALQIFVRIDVSLFLLGDGFAGLFLTSGFGGVLGLGE